MVYTNLLQFISNASPFRQVARPEYDTKPQALMICCCTLCQSNFACVRQWPCGNVVKQSPGQAVAGGLFAESHRNAIVQNNTRHADAVVPARPIEYAAFDQVVGAALHWVAIQKPEAWR